MKRKDLLIIVACFCGIGICYGLQYSFSIFFVEITKFFHTTKAKGALIFSITLLVYGLYSPIVGILTNRFGGRKIFKIAALLIFSGVVLSYFTKDINGLYITIGVITAIGMNSAGFVPSIIIITNNFTDKKGLALGIATTGVGVGAIIFSIISKILIDFLFWKSSLLLIGTFSSALIFSVSFLLPESPEHSEFKIDFSFLKRREFWLLQGGMSCGAMTIQGIMLHVVSCFIEKGAKESLATLTVSLIAVAGSFGKIFWGWLSDFFKPLTLYISSCFIIIFALFILLLSKFPVSDYIVILFPILFGIGYGSFAPLFPTLAFEIFNKDFGNAIGLLTMANGVGAFFSTYLMGYFYDIKGNYQLSIKFLLMLIFLSIILFILAFLSKKR